MNTLNARYKIEARTLTVFRGIKDVLASVIANERRSEGYWGIGTYYALTVQDAEEYIMHGGLADGDMKRWGYVAEFNFTGVVKKLTAEQLCKCRKDFNGEVDLAKEYPKNTSFLLVQGDAYNPPEGGEQLLITPKSKTKATLTRFWVYFVKDEDANYFASLCKKKNEKNKVGFFSANETKKVDECLARMVKENR